MVEIAIEYRDLRHALEMLGMSIWYDADNLIIRQVINGDEVGPGYQIPYKALQ